MINNLNLVESINDNTPQGLNNITVEQLDKITNNFVSHIDCICLDEFNSEMRKKVIVMIHHKLCINGTMNLKFINLDLLANKIQKGETTGEKFSELLPKIKSIWSEIEINDVVSQLPVKIINAYYDNIYTILKLEKTQ